MSSGSGSRKPPPSNHHGSEGDFQKRRNYYPSSTRRDFLSNSLSSPASQSSSAPSAYSKPTLRAEKLSDYISRAPRYRDSSAAPNPNNHPRTKPSAFSKDTRYPSYGKQYSFSSGYNQERPNGAYGSFSSAKKETDSYNSYHLRDNSSRDMVNGSSQRDSAAFSRSSWRSDRPKLNVSSAPVTKPFPSSRFNPNNIPVSSRAGLNSLLSSGFGGSKRERYDNYDEKSSNRWKPYGTKKYDRPSSSGTFGRLNNKERIRSSGLTNSVGNPKRSDSYLPEKNSQQSRYTDRYSRDQNEEDDDEDSRKSDETKTAYYKYSDLVSGHEGEDKPSLPETSQLLDVLHDLDSHHTEHEDDDEHDEDRAEEEDDDDEEEEEEEEEDDEEEDFQDLSTELQDRALKSISPTSEVPDYAPSIATKPNATAQNTSKAILSEENDLLETGAITYPDGCNFPLTEIDFKLEGVKSELAKNGPLKYASVSSEDFISSLPTTSYNLRKFQKNFTAFTLILRTKNLEIKKKRILLWKTYDAFAEENQKRSANMSEQLEFLHNADDETRKELESIDIRVKPTESVPESPALDAPAPLGRRGRRHGDLVTTEAEFQEILKTLKNEDDEDPLIKAKQVSAEIPDLILDPVERQAFKFMDSNNLVQDKGTWELRLKTDFATNFTENEHDLYCDAFCRAPKRFGEISQIMGGLRSLQECVLHYYITKKNVNYKFMVSQYKKKASKKNARRKRKAKEVQISGETIEMQTESDIVDQIRPLIDESSESGLKRPSEIIADVTIEPIKKRGRVDAPMGEHPKSAEFIIGLKPEASKSAALQSVSLSSTENEGLGIKTADDVVDAAAMLAHTEPSIKTDNSTDAPPVPTKQNGVISNSNEALTKPDVLEPMGALKKEETRTGENEATTQNSEHHDVDVGEKRRQISSYWSVTDVNAFPGYLAEHGSKWTLIADKMATKSATMVRNYYQRNAEKFAWNALVAAADERTAQKSAKGGSSLVESTIVVKPQKVADKEVKNTLETQPEKAVSSSVQVSNGAPLVVTPVRPHPMAAVQPREESHKPSILSLLNAELTPENIKKAIINPPPRNNDLAALLNAPSSPVPPKEAEAKPREKANSISSLLG